MKLYKKDKCAFSISEKSSNDSMVFSESSSCEYFLELIQSKLSNFLLLQIHQHKTRISAVYRCFYNTLGSKGAEPPFYNTLGSKGAEPPFFC